MSILLAELIATIAHIKSMSEREAWGKMMTYNSLRNEAKSRKIGEDMVKSMWLCRRDGLSV